jgi:hypothetical protein
MKNKFLLILAICVVCFAAGCRPQANTGCNYNYCCIYGQNNSPFTAIYPSGYRYRGTIGLNGVGTYPIRDPGSGLNVNCGSIAALPGNFFGFSLTAQPGSVDLQAQPSTMIVSGQGIDATYGMPLVEYFDTNGYLIGSVTATSVAGDYSWVEAPVPDLSSVYSGNYQIQVTNIRSDGNYLDIVGTAPMYAWGRDRPDSDGDGWFDDEDCHPYDPSRWSCFDGGGGCNNQNIGPQMPCEVY